MHSVIKKTIEPFFSFHSINTKYPDGREAVCRGVSIAAGNKGTQITTIMADITNWTSSSVPPALATRLSPSNTLASPQCGGGDLAPWAACWCCNKCGNYRRSTIPPQHHSDYKACNHTRACPLTEKQLPDRPLAPCSPASWSNCGLAGLQCGPGWRVSSGGLRFGSKRIESSGLVL